MSEANRQAEVAKLQSRSATSSMLLAGDSSQSSELEQVVALGKSKSAIAAKSATAGSMYTTAENQGHAKMAAEDAQSTAMDALDHMKAVRRLDLTTERYAAAAKKEVGDVTVTANAAIDDTTAVKNACR